MGNALTINRHSSLEHPTSSSFTSSMACDRSISYLIAKILQAILPKTLTLITQPPLVLFRRGFLLNNTNEVNIRNIQIDQIVSL